MSKTTVPTDEEHIQKKFGNKNHILFYFRFKTISTHVKYKQFNDNLQIKVVCRVLLRRITSHFSKKYSNLPVEYKLLYQKIQLKMQLF